MASTCPNCGKKLHWYNVKAECSDCGVSIPNFNWEARLEEDNQKAEQKFTSFYRGMNRLAYSVWGTKLRIARIILSFIPVIGFILPWATIKSDASSVGLDLFGMTCKNSLLNIFKDFFGNMGLYFANMSFESNAGVLTFTMLSLLFMVLSLVFAVVAFFLILILAKHSKTKAMFVLDVFSVASMIASAVLFTVGVSGATNQIGFNFGTIPIYNATGGVAWGFYIALALMCVATVANFLVAKAPAKSDDDLENERLARKAEKEEKERQEQIKKEKQRIEAERIAAQEQAEAVEKAKAELAAEAEKKNSKKK